MPSIRPHKREAILLIAFILLSAVSYMFFHNSYEINLSNGHYRIHKKITVSVSQPLSKLKKSKTTIDSEKSPKIAYIFAGGVRSFVCPKVHWSIKSHLIDSLDGDPHVFIRLAEDDNKNIKTGTGTLWNPNYRQGEVEETLKILNPRVVQKFSFATEEAEMKRNHPEMIHTVFRENDRRRYSMFYHRCMAYKLMLQYERDNHMRFDWVLLVRLDAGWLEPMLPITTYANDRVWVTESGFNVFNDQFMMMPRQYSDYLYDLNTKVPPEVYCLGGPDVEKWKCKRGDLESLDFDPHFINETLNHCCPDIHKKGKNKLGRSEVIHARHLEHGAIPVSLGRFPVFLVRRRDDGRCAADCFRIYGYHYKEYLFLYEKEVYPFLMPPTWADTNGRAISSRDRVLCYMMDEDIFPWNPITAFDLSQKVKTLQTHTKPGDLPNQTFSLDYSKPLQTQLSQVHPSILLNPKDTQIWRIHPTWNVGGCLTYSFRNQTLGWERCQDHLRLKNIRFDSRQLFFLQVVPFPEVLYSGDRGQEISIADHPSTPKAFIASGTKYLKPLEKQLNPDKVLMRVFINHCDPRKWDHRDIVMCLTVRVFKVGARVFISRCSKDPLDPTQLFQAIRPLALGSSPHSVIGEIKMATTPFLCVGREVHVVRGLLKVPKNNDFFLRRCDSMGAQNLVQFEFELIS